MPESDIFPLDPDYPVEVVTLPGTLLQEAESGRALARLVRPDRRLFRLALRARSTDDIEQLRDWYARFRAGYFVFEHKVWVNNAGAFLTRRFPVRFAQPLQEELFAPHAYNGPVELLEQVGEQLQTTDYPDPAAGHPSFFLEEDDALAKALLGSWTIAAQANAHGTQEATNPNTNTTDAFQFLYAGYGFRLWARKDSNLGILRVLLDEADLGTVDLYAAAPAAAASLLAKLDVPLGLHRVKILATNTKNASSSANTIVADAIEVIP